MLDTLTLRLRNIIGGLDSPEDNFNIELENSAKCNFDGNTLKCTYNTRSDNPYGQSVDDPDRDYRFKEQITIENIILKSNGVENDLNSNDRVVNFEVTDNTKVDYVVKYPTYSNLDTERNIRVTSEYGESTVTIKGFSERTENDDFHFFDVCKGEKQSITKVEEDSFNIQNKGPRNLGSELYIDSEEQTLRDPDPENKSEMFEYNGTHQIMYRTEPYDVKHDLEINILYTESQW